MEGNGKDMMGVLDAGNRGTIRDDGDKDRQGSGEWTDLAWPGGGDKGRSGTVAVVIRLVAESMKQDSRGTVDQLAAPNVRRPSVSQPSACRQRRGRR